VIDLGQLQTAIDAHQLCAFDYVNKRGEATHRDRVEAYEIKGGYFYGFCPVHQQIHSFLIGSMANLQVYDETFVPRY
jgi:predicted DNA-binding transcriptional regulator YafY